MDSVNSKKKYKYDYPENKEFSKTITIADRVLIATGTGYTYNTIVAIFQGKRKMPSKVRDFAQKIIDINNQKLELIPVKDAS